MEEKKKVTLPENAFRELKPGEQYQPLLRPDKVYPEVTVWSVTVGLVMTIIFSAAAAFLGLKVGQVFEAAIPISIIAVGLSSAFKRKNALGENVIIQSIGACSGVIVAGAIFTLPALYILQDKYPELTVDFSKIFLSSLIGGVLGILLLIPFRKYFVKEQHGKYPFPEATATTQVIVSGESGGKGAKTLLISGLVGGLYDFIVSTFGWWSEVFTSRVLPWGEQVATNAKLLLKVNVGAAVLGLGYIIGRSQNEAFPERGTGEDLKTILYLAVHDAPAHSFPFLPRAESGHIRLLIHGKGNVAGAVKWIVPLYLQILHVHLRVCGNHHNPGILQGSRVVPFGLFLQLPLFITGGFL